MPCNCGRTYNRPVTDPSESSDNENQEQYWARHNYSGRSKNRYSSNTELNEETWNTVNCIRHKPSRFITSEHNEKGGEDRACLCGHNFETRYRGADALRRANDLIDYAPESEFLKRVKQQCRFLANNEPNIFSEIDKSVADDPCSFQIPVIPPGIFKDGIEEVQDSSYDQYCSLDGQYLIPNKVPSTQNVRSTTPVRKSEHISRSKKPKKCRGRRKRKSDSEEKCESEQFEPTLKRPHENSCERCWRYASPARSPVNKPQQKYDPNFRRGHSCYDFEGGDWDPDVYDRHVSPCKNLQPITSRERVLRTPSWETEQSPGTPPSVIMRQVPTIKPFSSSWQRSPDVQPAPVVKKKPQELKSQTIRRTKEVYDIRESSDISDLWSPVCPRGQTNFPATPQGISYSEPIQKSRPKSWNPDITATGIPRGSIYMDDLDVTEYPTFAFSPTEKKTIDSPKPTKSIRLYSKEPQQPVGETLPSPKSSSPPKPCLRTIPEVQGSESSKSRATGEELEKSVRVQSPKSPRRPTPPSKSSKSPVRPASSPSRTPKSPNRSGSRTSPSKSSKSPARPASSPGKTSMSPNRSGSRTSPGKCPKSPKRTAGSSSTSKSPQSPRRPATASPSKGRPKSPSPKREVNRPAVRESPPKSPKSEVETIRSPEVVRTPKSSTPRSHLSGPQSREDSFMSEIRSPPRAERPSLVQYSGMDHPVRECPCDPDHALVRDATYDRKRLLCCHCDWHEENKSLIGVDGKPIPKVVVAASPRQNVRDGKTFECPHRAKVNLMSDQPIDNTVSSSFERECRILSELQHTPSIPSSYQEMSPIVGSPRKYYMFYMTKCTEKKGDDDVEVLVEELMQTCPNKKDVRTKDITEKMKKIMESPSDSMALRFQKGVSEQCRTPQSSRILYF